LRVEARDEARADTCLPRSEGEANPAFDGVTGRGVEFPLAFAPFRAGTVRFFPALESLRLFPRPLDLVSMTGGTVFPWFCEGLLFSSLFVGLVDLAFTPQSSRSGRLPSSVSPAQSIAEGVYGRGVAGAEGFKVLSLSTNPFTFGGGSLVASTPLICGGASLAC
jgi:hypothetical protein